MSPELIKLVVGGVIGMHGVGHVLGWLPAWGITQFEGASSRSWLLTDALGNGASGALGGALWLASTVGFVAAAGGLFAGQGWWRTLAVVSAVISTVAIALYPDALPAGSRIGAIVVNVAILGGLLVAGWPSAATVGS